MSADLVNIEFLGDLARGPEVRTFPETPVQMVDGLPTIAEPPEATDIEQQDWGPQDPQSIINQVARGAYVTRNAVERLAPPKAKQDEVFSQGNQRPFTRAELRQLRKTPEGKQIWDDVQEEEKAPYKGWFKAERMIAAKVNKVAQDLAFLLLYKDRRKEILAEEIGRRDFLFKIRDAAEVVGGGLVLAEYGFLGNVINSLSTYIDNGEIALNPANKPSATPLDGAVYNGQKQITIYMPGFGDVHSLIEAELWKVTSGVPKDEFVIALDYSNRGATPKQMVEAIGEVVDLSQVEIINWVDRSIGGLFMLKLIPLLRKTVGNVLMMACPSRLALGDFGEFGKFLAKLPMSRGMATDSKYGVNAERITRANDPAFMDSFTETVESIADSLNPFASSHKTPELPKLLENLPKAVIDTPANLGAAWQATMDGADVLALQEEDREAAPISAGDSELRDELRPYMKRGVTKFKYTATDEPMTDKTVKTVESGEEYKAMCDDLDVECDVDGLPYKGHANVEATSKFTSSWAKENFARVKILAGGPAK